MAIVNLSDRVKRIISVVLTILATAILGFAEIFGWALPNWATITDIVVLLLASILGIVWVPPKKPANDTGGSG